MFVGHPMAGADAPKISREAFARRYQLDLAKPWIALLPGSRRGEVSRIFPTLLKAAQLLGPNYVYIVPVASTLDESWMRIFLASEVAVTLTNDAQATLTHARAAAVASGTSTLQAALIGTPFAMVYRVAPLTWRMGRRLVKVDRFAMPNLVAERDVVPELVQNDFTAARVAAEIRRLLPDSSERTKMVEGFAEVRRRLQGGSSQNDASRTAARAILAEACRSGK
jgi:lipid-A-disaccharide synthase